MADNNDEFRRVHAAVAVGESAAQVRRAIVDCAQGSSEWRVPAVNQAGEGGKTPLRAAHRLRRGDLVGLLLEAGARVDGMFEYCRVTPLGALRGVRPGQQPACAAARRPRPRRDVQIHAARRPRRLPLRLRRVCRRPRLRRAAAALGRPPSWGRRRRALAAVAAAARVPGGARAGGWGRRERSGGGSSGPRRCTSSSHTLHPTAKARSRRTTCSSVWARTRTRATSTGGRPPASARLGTTSRGCGGCSSTAPRSTLSPPTESRL
jgi:hypothetical protein